MHAPLPNWKTLNYIWRHFWLPQVGRSNWHKVGQGQGCFETPYNTQNRLYHKNHHAPNDDSANPALMLHIQIFAGFRHAIFMSLQVHFTHCYIPRASHTTWSMMLFRAGCFISLGIFVLKENSHREVCIHANGFYMFATVSIHTFLSCNLLLHCFFVSTSTWECTT